MEKLTLEDVAAMAGVSRSTVSRVVNNQPHVNAETRQRVLEIIEETGYRPYGAVRTPASKRCNVIGLIIPRSVQALFTDPYFPRLIQGVAAACNQADQTFALFLPHTREEEQILYRRISRKRLVDGVVVQVGKIGDELVSKMVEAGIPFVVAGRPHQVDDASYVNVDNLGGAYNAVSHLIRLGHTRIGTVTGGLNTTAGQDRCEGYRRALNEQGLTVDECLLVEGDYTETGGYLATQRLLEQKPDAVFVASDVMALGALRAIREAHLSVPRDIALVGFDDLPPATMVDPPLTTARQPIRRLGSKAVETLLEIIEYGNQPPRRFVFDTELIIRKSCGSS
jgi:LacI family transcriptional regulator